MYIILTTHMSFIFRWPKTVMAPECDRWQKYLPNLLSKSMLTKFTLVLNHSTSTANLPGLVGGFICRIWYTQTQRTPRPLSISLNSTILSTRSLTCTLRLHMTLEPICSHTKTGLNLPTSQIPLRESIVQPE